MEATAKKVSELERAMMELVYQSRLTEIKIAQLSEESRLTEINIKQLSNEMKEFKEEMKKEMKEFKEEMRASRMEREKEMKEFKEEMRASKKEMDKKWGDLARKMGTLIEDIFIPSLDLAIEKYFKVTPKDVMPRRRIRRNGDTIEIDILALAADNKAFVVEVKASPDRIEYVNDFLEKLRKIPDFIPEINNYKIIPIYAALNIQESTINFLTKNHIYAMVVKGDYLEIVNFEDIAG